VPEWVEPTLAARGISFAARECTTREELAALAGEADVVWVFGTHRCLSAENLDVLGRCGAIIRTGSGTDNIPIDAATARGIVVATTPDANVEAVSDHAVGLLLTAIRQIARQDRAVRAGIWDRHVAWPGWHMRGSVVGLVGFGRIARAVADKLHGFGAQLCAFDPYVEPELLSRRNVRSVTLEDLLATSDFVSLHCPLTPRTRHLLDESALRRMKPTAVLVNTARGAIIDQQALIRALREGWIAAAALDVLEDEPPAANAEILTLDNVVLTPHIAAYSDTYLDESWRLSVDSAIAFAGGRWPRSYVNPTVTPRWSLA
jgi:D-3-phosphoglycerate dehydrogenase